MNRRSPDLARALSAYYARRHPLRPPKEAFGDELLALADFLWAQIDPDGTRPLVFPPAHAEGALVQPTARPSGKRGARVD